MEAADAFKEEAWGDRHLYERFNVSSINLTQRLPALMHMLMDSRACTASVLGLIYKVRINTDPDVEWSSSKIQICA